MKEEVNNNYNKMGSRIKEHSADLIKINKQLKKEIAEHRESEAALHESDKRNTALLQAMPDILFVLGRDGTYIDIKAARKEDLTIPIDQLIGKNVRDIGFSDYDLKAILNCIENVLQTAKRQFLEYELNTPKELRFYEAVVVPFGKYEILASVRDITKHRKAEKALKEGEARYRNMFNSNQSVMLIVDPENADIVDANPAAISFYGWSYKELTRKKITDIASLTIDQVFAKVELVKNWHHQHYIDHHRLITGDIREVEVFNSPVIINGKTFMFPIIHDISKRIADEQKVQSLIKELKESRTAADVANLAKSTFLANMSHELRTPLNSILGFSQLLEMEKDSFDTRQVEFLEHIKNSSNHLLEMVNDILDLSKIEAGKIEINKKPFALNQMMARLPMAVKSLVFQKGIELIVDIDFDCEIIQADEVRLKQVLYNLLSNAIKFTDPKKKIGIKARTSVDVAVIEVWDEGRGIDENDLGKVFDPFEQVGKTKQQGTGLGLAISRKLIELHGGTLTAESRIGEGSRFIIHIPGIILQSRKEIEQKKVKFPTGKRELERRSNILVVEDNVTNQMVIEAILNRLGYGVHIEGSGHEGIEAAMKEECDLILMDIQLPDMDGIETMREIRRKCKKRVPIVALTAYAMKGDLEKYKTEGFDGYISKPIVIERLK